MSKFYHYTSVKSLERLREDYGDISLRPRRRMIPLSIRSASIPERAHDGALFGLTEPTPVSWSKKWGHKSLLETVLGDISTGNYRDLLALAEITVDSKIDDIHVADWGVHDDPAYDGARDSDSDVLLRVKQTYAESLIPFDQYSDELGYNIPEVICFSPIPAARIKIVDIFDKYELVNQLRTQRGEKLAPLGWFRETEDFKLDTMNKFRQQYGLAPVQAPPTQAKTPHAPITSV